ncbi:YdcF family protein [Gracilibacillus caseinilyticus]|uniref:YdcF family protein n=1 Tax=Gracilibacillus caseinilyticus TaxID=2932256 RepID=A0ABY4EQJ1_9BACI|nr:YdcF family protein [Gracilibacillus caseinilyticus]UOQ46635.1 YdcF family protein [Gracilibacillus caseinilyticus]
MIKKWLMLIIPLFLLVMFFFLFFQLHRLLVLEQSPKKVDAMIVLSGGTGDREAEAAKLYHEGYSDTIIVTGALVGWETYTSDIMREHLIKLGVPNDAIFDYKEVTSTREEAELSIPLLRELRVDSLMVVTNKYHSSRAAWIFERTLKKEGIEVISVPVRDDVFDRNWWKQHETRKQGATEVLKAVWELFRL